MECVFRRQQDKLQSYFLVLMSFSVIEISIESHIDRTQSFLSDVIEKEASPDPMTGVAILLGGLQRDVSRRNVKKKGHRSRDIGVATSGHCDRDRDVDKHGLSAFEIPCKNGSKQSNVSQVRSRVVDL